MMDGMNRFVDFWMMHHTMSEVKVSIVQKDDTDQTKNIIGPTMCRNVHIHIRVAVHYEIKQRNRHEGPNTYGHHRVFDFSKIAFQIRQTSLNLYVMEFFSKLSPEKIIDDSAENQITQNSKQGH